MSQDLWVQVPPLAQMKNKLKELEKDLIKYTEKLQHMSTQYSQTREGSAYGCEYYDIQCRVLQSQIEAIQKEINKVKKEEKLL